MKIIIATVSLLFSTLCFCDVPATQKNEVQYLINFVKESPCILERNGKQYQGDKSAPHIQKKYDYYKDKIKTTEQFIELSATKSLMSGRYYMVTCGDEKAIKTQQWLLQALSDYRIKSKTP